MLQLKFSDFRTLLDHHVRPTQAQYEHGVYLRVFEWISIFKSEAGFGPLLSIMTMPFAHIDIRCSRRILTWLPSHGKPLSCAQWNCTNLCLVLQWNKPLDHPRPSTQWLLFHRTRPNLQALGHKIWPKDQIPCETDPERDRSRQRGWRLHHAGRPLHRQIPDIQFIVQSEHWIGWDQFPIHIGCNAA